MLGPVCRNGSSKSSGGLDGPAGMVAKAASRASCRVARATLCLLVAIFGATAAQRRVSRTAPLGAYDFRVANRLSDQFGDREGKRIARSSADPGKGLPFASASLRARSAQLSLALRVSPWEVGGV